MALSSALSRAPGFGTSATLSWLCVPEPPPFVLASILTLNPYLGFLVRLLLRSLVLDVPALVLALLYLASSSGFLATWHWYWL